MHSIVNTLNRKQFNKCFNSLMTGMCFSVVRSDYSFVLAVHGKIKLTQQPISAVVAG